MALALGTRISGFVVRRITPIELMRSTAIELEHEGSGALALHLANDDTENLFSIVLRTPPSDDTGLPHIMEHSVLGGSAKYRGKDPFFALVKSSVATFINAMTACDHTVYPVASTVPEDLWNLADVYWDAVFRPLLTEHTFRREGHRLELLEKGELSIKGIVYSEMQGAYSSPDSLIYQVIRRELFADSIYGRDSGGDPETIPELRYEAYKRFHERHYHPGKALLFFYGNISTEKYLAFVAERLVGVERRAQEPEILRQPRWSSPRTARTTYPVSPAEEGKAYLAESWLYGDGADPIDTMALRLLYRVLIGNEGAPLRRALIDSKLGDDVALAGADVDGIDTTYSIGLKGSQVDRADTFARVVENTLEGLAKGIRREAIEAAAQQLAYQTLAISESFPVHLLFRLSPRYAIHRDPIVGLDISRQLAEVKERALSDASFLPKLIRDRLLSNPHRLLVVAEGKSNHAKERDERTRQKLRQKKAAMSPEALSALLTQAREFEAIENEDQTAALAALPVLHVSDLPKKPRTIPSRLEKDGRLEWIENEVFANGINYVDVAIDLRALPLAVLPWVAVYAECLQKMGAAGTTWVEMAERVASSTSGVSAWTWVGGHATDPSRVLRTLHLSTSFLDGQADRALSILEDLLFAFDPSDTARLRDVLIQAHAEQRSSLGLSGDRLARAHASRTMSAPAALASEVHGLPMLRLFETLSNAARAEGGGLDAATAELLGLRALIGRSGRLLASFTGSNADKAAARKRITAWAARLTGSGNEHPVAEPAGSSIRSGLAAPMDVAFCTYVTPGPGYTDPATPPAVVGSQHLGMGHVLDEVRLKGSAYGAWLRTDPFTRVLSFGSYRDPNVKRTLDVFERAAGVVRAAAWSQQEIDKTILVCAKDSLKPNRPRDATGTAMSWHLLGLTDPVRTAYYEKVLCVTAEGAKKALLDALEKGRDRAATCVVSSRDKLETANAELGARALAVEDVFAKDR
jgi:presequence protease